MYSHDIRGSLSSIPWRYLMIGVVLIFGLVPVIEVLVILNLASSVSHVT